MSSATDGRAMRPVFLGGPAGLPRYVASTDLREKE
jgi:hypothetical protein